jgi:hypothetical protein
MTSPKILNTFEFLVLSLIPFGLSNHYDPHVSSSFLYYNDSIRLKNSIAHSSFIPLLLFAKHFMPLMIIYLLPILILIIKIITTKRYLEAITYSDNILDLD